MKQIMLYLAGAFLCGMTTQIVYGMQEKKEDVLFRKLYPLCDPTKDVPEEYKPFIEEVQQKKCELDYQQFQTYEESFLEQEEIPTTRGGFFSSLWSYLPSLFSWNSRQQEDSDWKLPLILKDFDGVFAYAVRGAYVDLIGMTKYQLFDVKTHAKVVDYDDPHGGGVAWDQLFNADQSYCAVLTLKKNVHIYDMLKGGEIIKLTYEKSCNFMQTRTTATHFVTLNEKTIIIHDCKDGKSREVALPDKVREWHWTDSLNVPHSLIVQLEDNTVYFISAYHDYKAIELADKDTFTLLKHDMYKAPYIVAQVDDTIVLYDVITGEKKYTGIIERGDVLFEGAYFSPKFDVVAIKTVSCIRNGIVLYHLGDPQPIFVDLAGDDRKLSPVMFSSDSTYFSYRLDEQTDSTWRCHFTKDGALLYEQDLRVVSGLYGWVPNSSLFIIMRWQKDPIFMYDAKNGKAHCIKHDTARSLATKDACVVALLKKKQEESQEGKFYTLKGDAITQKSFSTDEPCTLVGSAFNAHGTKFALSGEKKFYVYDISSGRYEKSFAQEPGNAVQSFDFSKEDYFTALGSQSVKVFSQKNYDLLHTLSFKDQGIKDGSFSHDKKIFQIRTAQTNGPLVFYYMHHG